MAGQKVDKEIENLLNKTVIWKKFVNFLFDIDNTLSNGILFVFLMLISIFLFLGIVGINKITAGDVFKSYILAFIFIVSFIIFYFISKRLEGFFNIAIIIILLGFPISLSTKNYELFSYFISTSLYFILIMLIIYLIIDTLKIKEIKKPKNAKQN